MTSASLRRDVVRALKMQGLSAQAEAVKALVSVLSREADPGAALEAIVDCVKERVERGEVQSSILDLDTVSQVVDDLSKDEEDFAQEALQLFDAHSWPKLAFDPLRKAFRMEPATGRRVNGDPGGKGRIFRERFAMIQQRVSRMDLFNAPLLQSSKRQFLRLTPIEALLGSSGCRTLLGTISQVEEGKYYLEDLSASVPVDLSAAQTMGGLITEGCTVIAEGELRDGTFHVDMIGFPPPESRASALEATGYMDVFGNGTTPNQLRHLREMEEEATDAMFVILSDVHLDKALVLEKLRVLLEGFRGVRPLPLFLFTGNFTSQAIGHGTDSVEQFLGYFNQLADLIADFPEIASDARFVFVPGPHDPGAGNTVPRPGLPALVTKALRKRLRHVQFASNPCRIRFYAQEIVIFREDMLKKMLRHCLLPAAAPGEGADVSEHLVRTLLDQGHLCPLPLAARPILWDYDAALRLYPLPDAVVLADSAEQYTWRYEECLAINPGSFSGGDFNFVVYRPAVGESECSRIDG